MAVITATEFKDKIYGAWAGKCAGGLIGAKQENNKALLHYTFENVFPDTPVPNDDFDLQILYIGEVLSKKGFNFTQRDLADAFCKYNKCWANEYRVAIKNIDTAIYPKASGEFCNKFFKNSNGCPIRSELWGILAAGNPALAAEFVETDGYIDHSDESVEVEKFFAIAECLAFFENDVKVLIDKALEYTDKNSNVYKCIKFVGQQARLNKDWKITRTRLIREFGSSDASYSVVNLGIVILALLYGEMEFDKTMLTAVNCGYDTDCTSATAGSILGIILGKKGMSKKWLDKIGEEFIVGTVETDYKKNKLTELTDDVFDFAYSLVRDKLTDLCITGLPTGYKCNVPEKINRIEVKTEYAGLPVISAANDCMVTVTLINKTDVNQTGRVSVQTPDYIVCCSDTDKLTLPANSEASINLKFTLKENIEYLPVRNICTFMFSGSQEVRAAVGFMGEAKYKVFGPYFDNYDTKIHETDINGELMPKDLFAMFNSYVNIDKEYLPESAELSDDFKVFYSAEDLLPIENIIGYKGTCCVYVEREFLCEKDETIHMIFGYSNPCKVFLNGELIFENHSCVNWMPFNYAIEANLKKGKNVLVYKVARQSGTFEFSNILSKREHGNGVLVDLDNKQ